MTRYNLKVPPFQILLGGTDITDAVVGFSFRHPLAEPSTPLIWTGSIEMYPVRSGLPRSFFDDELNPSRWLSGQQPIDVYFNGSWWQRFRIKPSGYKFNQDNGQAEIEITDIIGILDSYQPAADAPEFKTGGNNRWSDLAVAFIRKQASLMGIAVSVTPPPFNNNGTYQIPRTIRGSYIKEAQKMAGERQIWMWSNKEVISWATYQQNGVVWQKSRKELLNFTRQQGLEPVVSEVTVSATHEQFDDCQLDYPRKYYTYISAESAKTVASLAAPLPVYQKLASSTYEDLIIRDGSPLIPWQPIPGQVTVNPNKKKFGHIYIRTKRVEGNPAIVLFGGQIDIYGRVTVQIPDVKGYTITKASSGAGTFYDWLISYTKAGATFQINWQQFRLLLEEQTVTTYENVPADALNASKLVSQVVTKSEPWAKFPEFMAQFSVSTWFAVSINNPRYITERTTTRYKYREIFRDDIIVAKGVKLYEIDTIEEFTERVYLRKDEVGGLQPYTRYTPQLVPFEYTKTVYTKECLTRWQERKETSINKGQNTKSSGYLFQQKTEVRDVYSIPEIQYRPPAYPVTQKPLLATVQTGRAGVSNFVQSRDFQSASTLTTTAELSAYAKWLGEIRWQRYYSREIACGYTSTLGYAPFQGVMAGNGLFICDRFGISLNNEGDSWQFVEDCIGNKIGTIPEIAAPPIAYPPLLISTLNIAAIATQTLTVGIPIEPIQLAAVGGTAPYTFSSATLPLGLSISGAQIVGTPLAIATTSVTVTVTDSLSATSSTTFNIVVVAAPVPVPIVEETYTLDISVALDVTVSLSIGVPVPFEVEIDVGISVTVTMVLMKVLTSNVPLGAIASNSRISRVSLLNSEVPLGAIASNTTVQRVIELTSDVPLGAIGSDAVVETPTTPEWRSISQDEWRGIGQNQWRETQ